MLIGYSFLTLLPLSNVAAAAHAKAVMVLFRVATVRDSFAFTRACGPVVAPFTHALCMEFAKTHFMLRVNRILSAA